MPPDVDVLPADEELTSGSRWPWLGLGLLAVALVAGLLVARLAERHGSGPAARPSATHAGPQPRTHLLALDPRTSCPDAGDGQTLCTTSSHVPAAVFAAVRAEFPHARRVHAVEERLRDVGFGPGGVWYRQLRATAGQRTITVVVRQRTADDQSRAAWVSDAGRGGRVEVTQLSNRRAVDVTVRGPDRHLPAFHVIRALARDPRLLTAS